MNMLEGDNIGRWKNRKLSITRFGVLCFGYVAYLCIGAMVFSLVESPVENEIRLEIYNARDTFRIRATCVSGKTCYC